MLSNFDIEEISNHFNIQNVVVMKDELKKIHPSSYQNYIINLQSSDKGNGTHWMALKIKNKECVYFDSYGYLPPEEIITFCKRIKHSHLSYNTKQIQDLSAITCGFFSIAFLIFLKIDSSLPLYKRSSNFSNLFDINTKVNNGKLQIFFRLLPNEYSLPVLKKLYSQK